MNVKRMRTRHHRSSGSNGASRQLNGQIPMNRNHVFDSHGPDVRVRGTAQQLFEKYLQLGRDATGSGDRVAAEAYFQHAEHYFRILNAMAQAAQQSQQERAERQAARQPRAQSNSSEDEEDDQTEMDNEGTSESKDLSAAPQPELSEG
ncbi:DUF4167 domain-containing protein [Acetobacter lambici]|uniref:DUF4167 domain-containing protein n=1 Tax=Acetobacter lambici TaxID=1332824 RepID=A0ABT1EVY5_9PROT|nr:DUF4167 domain-containing protein [Acetobacter lambici]MCP1241236.1 DUF4167 domain-containing protein [Acetobacter lambici]MCP1257093.1 DUF4167 domain-containing protein [Acetobacter lambici]NHO55586.1 DUF4167 domain-containing protein [Acetobacter lambici]